jgi:FlaG/FlaF family flagellin (archaellin)
MEPQLQDEQKQEHGVGPIIGVIIIVAIMVIGGVYFLLSETNKPAPEQPGEEATTEE